MAPFSGDLTHIVVIMLMWQKFLFGKSLIEMRSYLRVHTTALPKHFEILNVAYIIFIRNV